MNTVDTGSSHSRRVHRNSQVGLDVNVLGVFTGSGLDEFNCVLVRYHQDAPKAPLRAHILQHGKVPIPSRNRIPLLTIFHDVQRQLSAISEFNTRLGQEFSRGIKTFCKDHDITLDSIDLIGTHSSNVAPRRRSPDMSAFHSFSWNSTITAETGVTTIFDFAVADSSTRPTPPVAFVEKLFLRHPSKFRACLQISELANFTFIPCLADGDLNGTISHDCGPGSLLIDYAMRYCTSNNYREDDNGTFATPGVVNQDIVKRFLSSHDYLWNPPPLSIAREISRHPCHHHANNGTEYSKSIPTAPVALLPAESKGRRALHLRYKCTELEHNRLHRGRTTGNRRHKTSRRYWYPWRNK